MMERMKGVRSVQPNVATIVTVAWVAPRGRK